MKQAAEAFEELVLATAACGERLRVTASPFGSFLADALLHCRGGRMKVLAVIEQPEVVTKILGHLGMSTVPEDIAPARRPPRQLDLDIA